MMERFYGGMPGKDFSIKHIFKSYYGAEFDSIQADLQLGWTSDIAAGDFVIVSYGKTSDAEYDNNRKRDYEVDGRSYNSTLWQKEYNEVTGLNTGGFNYKFISQMTGNTPSIDITLGTPVDAGQDPYIEYDNNNVDSPRLVLHLSRSQFLHVLYDAATDAINADQDPYLEYDDVTDVNNPTLRFKLPKSQILKVGKLQLLDAKSDPEIHYNTTDINNPVLTIKLPKGQALEMLPMEALNAGQTPQVIYDDVTDVNKPTIKFKLPQSQVLSLKEFKVVDADQPPTVTFDDTEDKNNPTLTISIPCAQVLSIVKGASLDVDQEPQLNYDDEDVNNPVLTLSLPLSQVIQLATIEEYLDVGSDPEVRLDTTGEGCSINKPALRFKLPKSQQFTKSNVTSEDIDADQTPTVEFDDSTDPNNPKLVFSLPVSQVMQSPSSETLDPSAPPSVAFDDNSTTNEPKLKFSLPRAIKFYFGTLLGENTNPTYTMSDIGYGIGDYYINKNNGFIYKIIEKNSENNTVTAEYQACLQAPTPTVSVNGINPYTAEGSINEPTVLQTATEAGWEIVFGIPKAPTINYSFNFVGPSERGEVKTVAVNDSLQFQFKIPAGAKIYTGTEIATAPTVARPGDIFLNTNTGEVYTKFLDGSWNKQSGSLKGPQGNALQIVYSGSTTLANNTLEAGVAFIKTQMPSGYDFQNDEIFALTQVEEDGSSLSYWYYCYDVPNNQWDRVQLTGNTASSIEDDYYTGTDVKSYTTRYINSLIGDNDTNKQRSAYSKEKAEEMISWGEWDVNGNLKLK